MVDTDLPEFSRLSAWAGHYDLTVENGEVLYRKVGASHVIIRYDRLAGAWEVGRGDAYAIWTSAGIHITSANSPLDCIVEPLKINGWTSYKLSSLPGQIT